MSNRDKLLNYFARLSNDKLIDVINGYAHAIKACGICEDVIYTESQYSDLNENELELDTEFFSSPCVIDRTKLHHYAQKLITDYSDDETLENMVDYFNL